MKQITKKLSLFCLVLLIGATGSVQSVFADDVPFFSSNDVLFYSEKGCSVQNGNGDVAIIGNDNAEKIFKFLTSTNFKGTGDKPFNAIQAAGALGNFFQESTMDPAAIEDSGRGEGYGLAQWSHGRKAILLNLAKSEGKEWSDLGLQMKMIENELNNKSGFDAEGARLLAHNTEFGTFATVTDPAKASFIFQSSYERAGTPMQEKRDSAAKAYYEKFKDLAPSSVSIESSSCGNNNGGLTAFMGKDFTIYNQCQYPPYGGSWGTQLNAGGYSACSVACGPTSLAMVVKNMTGQNITPKNTIDYYDQQKLWASVNGYGNGSWVDGLKAGADHWGLRTDSIDTKDVNAYKEVFSKGGLVIVSGQGGAPYLPQGHYVVIRGITDDGKFRIGDPGRSETNGTPEDPKDWDTSLITGGSQPAGSVAVYKK